MTPTIWQRKTQHEHDKTIRLEHSRHVWCSFSTRWPFASSSPRRSTRWTFARWSTISCSACSWCNSVLPPCLLARDDAPLGAGSESRCPLRKATGTVCATVSGSCTAPMRTEPPTIRPSPQENAHSIRRPAYRRKPNTLQQLFESPAISCPSPLTAVVQRGLLPAAPAPVARPAQPAHRVCRAAASGAAVSAPAGRAAGGLAGRPRGGHARAP